MREAASAERYLRLARVVKQFCGPAFRHQVAACAATSLSNATALAAEMLALGGLPPASPLEPRDLSPASQPIDDYVRQARTALAHYQSRLVMARRLGLLRLQEVFWDIVLSKRRHLAHARVLASAGGRLPER